MKKLEFVIFCILFWLGVVNILTLVPYVVFKYPTIGEIPTLVVFLLMCMIGGVWYCGYEIKKNKELKDA